MAARPYSQMLSNVLKSLVSRADIYDPQTGEPRHPLLAERPENNILLVVVTGDKGLAAAFNTNILKMVTKFIQSKPEANIDIETIGRKGRDFMRRRYPTASQKVSSAEGQQEAEDQNKNEWTWSQRTGEKSDAQGLPRRQVVETDAEQRHPADDRYCKREDQIRREKRHSKRR